MQLCFCKTKICDWQFMLPCVTHNTYFQTLALSVIGRIGVIRASPPSPLTQLRANSLPFLSCRVLQTQPKQSRQWWSALLINADTFFFRVSFWFLCLSGEKNWFWIRMCKIYSATSFQGRRLKRFLDLGLGRGYSGAQVGNFKTIY